MNHVKQFNGDGLMTLNDVSKILAVTKQFVYRLVKAGELKSIRIGKKSIRVRPADIEDFISRHSMGADL